MKNDDDWIERFGEPLEIDGSTMIDGNHGPQHREALENADPDCIWSVYESLDTENMYLIPGEHIVNIVGYVISEKPLRKDDHDADEWMEVLWIDAEEVNLAP